MAVYALGDLHFGFAVKKPMHVFGERWKDHAEKIIKHWKMQVKEDDLVLLAGDISWGMRLEEAQADLDVIDSLPGKKILLEGNHDYWWKSSSRLSGCYPKLFFLKNNCFFWNGVFFCGSRGWLCPNDNSFTPQDEKIYRREQIRMQLSLQAAMQRGAKEIVVMMHYPPVNDKQEASDFTELFRQYPVRQVVFGHLHGEKNHRMALQGKRDGIEYHLVSADYLDFRPKLILE